MRLDLPTPGGPVTPTAYARARVRVELADELVGERVAVLDERDRARERAPVAGADACDERLARPVRAAPCIDYAASAARLRSSTARLGARRRSQRTPTTDAEAATDRRRPRTPSAAPSASVSGPATMNAEPEHGEVDAHDDGERAAAQLVRRAALDEQ